VKNYRPGWAPYAVVTLVLALSAIAGILYWESQNIYCGAGCPASTTNKESLNLGSFRVNSPTNVTVVITNVGTANSGFSEYIVKDPSGDTYTNSTLSWPTLAPGATVTVNILLAGQLSGQPFQFQSGKIYSVSVISVRNNQYTSTFTA
jgi:hypothetical protein